MKTLEKLKQLEKRLEQSSLPRVRRKWVGADVVISAKAPPIASEAGFYHGSRYVITPYSFELSWLFEEIKDAFYAEKRLDGCSKIEFFGRLANAANRCIQRSPVLTAHTLCAAVLHEAFEIYDEMEEGTFRCFAIAIGNEIVDDYVDDVPNGVRR